MFDKLKTELGTMEVDDCVHFLLGEGFHRLRDGNNKMVYLREDLEYVIKTYYFLPECRRATPFQTVRAYDKVLNDLKCAAFPLHDARRETFGFNLFRQYKPTNFFFGQGKDFVFIFQERVDPFQRSEIDDSLKAEKLQEVVDVINDMLEQFNRVWRPTTASVLDITNIKNWGLTRDEARRPVCFDGI